MHSSVACKSAGTITIWTSSGENCLNCLIELSSRLFLVHCHHASPYIDLKEHLLLAILRPRSSLQWFHPWTKVLPAYIPSAANFLVPSFLKNQPRFLPILFLVEVISSTTHFRHIILPSSSWGLKHQSKESYVLITANTYLNIFFKIFRKTSTSVWTSSHFPSSSWGLKHQSKESYVLIAAEYLSKYFLQNSQETSTSVWTSNHFKELSNQPPFLPSFLKYSTLYIRSW